MHAHSLHNKTVYSYVHVYIIVTYNIGRQSFHIDTQVNDDIKYDHPIYIHVINML